MSTVAERLTADEFLARDYPRRTELIDGMVIFNQPGFPHQNVCALILVELVTWTRSPRGRGTATLPLNLVLADDSVLSPDLMWFAEPLPLDLPRPDRVPELVVEVRSRSTWRYDIGRKRELYLRNGVKELWLVDPFSRSVVVYRGDDAYEFVDDELLTSLMLPGFAESVGELIPAA
jgi:Uma2 family endonuclease